MCIPGRVQLSDEDAAATGRSSPTRTPRHCPRRRPQPAELAVHHVQHRRGGSPGHQGDKVRPAAMSRYRWRGNRMLEITVREVSGSLTAPGLTPTRCVRRSTSRSAGWPHIHRARTSTSTGGLAPRSRRPHGAAAPPGGRRSHAGQATSHTPDERAILARSGLRLRPRSVRRGPLVNYRRTGAVDLRTVHACRRTLAGTHPAGDHRR
jgi:hypothetical protein